MVTPPTHRCLRLFLTNEEAGRGRVTTISIHMEVMEAPVVPPAAAWPCSCPKEKPLPISGLPLPHLFISQRGRGWWGAHKYLPPGAQGKKRGDTNTFKIYYKRAAQLPRVTCCPHLSHWLPSFFPFQPHAQRGGQAPNFLVLPVSGHSCTATKHVQGSMVFPRGQPCTSACSYSMWPLPWGAAQGSSKHRRK